MTITNLLKASLLASLVTALPGADNINIAAKYSLTTTTVVRTKTIQTKATATMTSTKTIAATSTAPPSIYYQTFGSFHVCDGNSACLNLGPNGAYMRTTNDFGSFTTFYNYYGQWRSAWDSRSAMVSGGEANQGSNVTMPDSNAGWVPFCYHGDNNVFDCLDGAGVKFNWYIYDDGTVVWGHVKPAGGE